MIMCVVLEGVAPEVALGAVLEAAPRVALDPPVGWLDVRGMDAAAVQGRVGSALRSAGTTACYGVAARPIVARLAAGAAVPGGLVRVPAGGERTFLAERPLADLGLADPLLGWLADVGIVLCGELAAVPAEAVEVRFGGSALRWWRWSRGDDDRRLFGATPPEQPGASVDFIDYVVTDPERLIFTTNALLGGLCERLRGRGAHARRLRLRLPLADGSVWERTLRAARPTADRAVWLRLARAVLERITVPDAVAGVGVEVEATEAAGAAQGDLFDTGFATAGVVEGSVARLLEDQDGVIRAPVVTAHPLVEKRGTYRPLTVREAMTPTGQSGIPSDQVGLTLQLLPEPRPVAVETAPRRDHHVPVRYRDGAWYGLLNAAGPDRVSGGRWDGPYAREYFRAVRTDGVLVWLYRDGPCDRWFLHGWWD
ncbi:MAG: hypothetical protein WEF86_05645 [Gemmatimonadota bacterium]